MYGQLATRLRKPLIHCLYSFYARKRKKKKSHSRNPLKSKQWPPWSFVRPKAFYSFEAGYPVRSRTMEDCISIEVGLRRRGEGEQRYFFQRETRFLNSQFIMIWDMKNLSINKAVC